MAENPGPSPPSRGFIRTVPNRCCICYTCVRACPAKAIRITRSQAEVVPERCIGCGQCIRVCPQRARRIVSTLREVEDLLQGPAPVAACLAPSFPAEFLEELEPRVLVGMVRRLGFARVTEAAFGGDLVAEGYRQLLAREPRGRFLASTCPAVVGFVERYQPELIPRLVPLVSPGVAMARALRVLDPGLRVVFVGPCVAAKAEGRDPDLPGAPDAVITFRELRSLFLRWDIRPGAPSDFDPPHPRRGTLLPLSRGLLQAVGLSGGPASGGVAVEGLAAFRAALEALAAGTLEARLVEPLPCGGCIGGPGLGTRESLFQRRARVARYGRSRLGRPGLEAWRRSLEPFRALDLSRGFQARDQRLEPPEPGELRALLQRMGKFSRAHELDCGACGFRTCREHATAIGQGLAEREMCLPFVRDDHLSTIRKLSLANARLASTQETLLHAERLASMGQLAAGVAHEINNPLGVVLMYTHLLLEEAPEALHPDLRMINDQAQRCKRIVAGLLDFARSSRVAYDLHDIREVIQAALASLAVPAGVTVEVRHGEGSPRVELDRDRMIQVFVNLVGNAFDALAGGGTVRVLTGADAQRLSIAVEDTGPGIPPENLNRLFEPFFTTKPLGHGTGLGLAVVHGILQLHRGEIRVESNADPAQGPTGTTFHLTLPRRGPES